jgi:hypothetical protein
MPPLPPLTNTLSNGQKMEVLKRFRHLYAEELAKIEAEMQNLLINLAEADYMAAFIGEQPEVVSLRASKVALEEKEKRRQTLGKLLERLDQTIPEQVPVAVSPPMASSSQKLPVRRY